MEHLIRTLVRAWLHNHLIERLPARSSLASLSLRMGTMLLHSVANMAKEKTEAVQTLQGGGGTEEEVSQLVRLNSNNTHNNPQPHVCAQTQHHSLGCCDCSERPYVTPSYSRRCRLSWSGSSRPFFPTASSTKSKPSPCTSPSPQ